MIRQLTSWSASAFAIDVRSLAAFRIAFGCVLIAHLIQIFPDLRAFYTDDGIFPREVATATTKYAHHSLYLLSGSFAWALSLWTITLIMAVCFVLGFRNRTATIALLILFISLNMRNPLIFQAGDRLVIMLIFWSCLLPLGSHWSIDARKRTPHQQQHTIIYNIASAGILLQMACLYFFTGVEKSIGSSWHQHNSVMFALQGNFSETTRELILDYPTLLYILNDVVLVFELCIPLLLFLPFFQPLIRMLCLIGLIIMHISFHYFLNIGLFSFDVMAGLFLFLPACFWDHLSHSNKMTRYYRTHDITTILSAAMLLLMLYGNMATVGWLTKIDWIREHSRQFKLNQQWKMFAPNVGSQVRWTYMRGHLYDGTVVDPFNRRKMDLSLTYPTDWREVVGGNLWLKFHTRIYHSKRQSAYLSYWCRDWNRHFPDKPLATIELLKREHIMAYPPIVKDASNVKESHLMTVNCQQD